LQLYEVDGDVDKRDALQLALVPPPVPEHVHDVDPPAEGKVGEDGDGIPTSQNGREFHPVSVDKYVCPFWVVALEHDPFIADEQSEFVVHELAGAEGVVTVFVTHCWLVLQV